VRPNRMLAKPFAPAQLVTAVSQFLNGGTANGLSALIPPIKFEISAV
jgi:hypothetical protein